MSLSLRFENAKIVHGLCLDGARVVIDAGRIVEEAPHARTVDLSGYMILPGIVDIHGDGFERHLAPRRGAMKDMEGGLIACEAELAANGITTGILAQFWSWEGGLRGPDFAVSMLDALAAVQPRVVTDLRAQLRLESHMLNDFNAFEDMVARFGVEYVVFNDHLPHDRLAVGKRPARLAGTALKSRRSPEALLALMQELHANAPRVPAALRGLSERLLARGVRLGSHDDASDAVRAEWRDMGMRISEFPETVEAAEAARQGGDGIILGAPNIMRGGSHKGNVSALDLIAMGLCDAIASDYHYPSLHRAAFFLAESGVCDLPHAWALISEGPARLLGLSDRGRIEPGLRADLVVIDRATHRLCATICEGRLSWLSGDLAERFVSARA